MVRRLQAARGRAAARRLLARAECAAGRRPRLALYDHALHLIGGGQKYGCMLAAALADTFDLTLVSHRPVSTGELGDWYGVDLSPARVRVVELPELGGAPLPDPAEVRGDRNPFASVGPASAEVDLFVNNSMNELVPPRAGRSVVVCHFPERRPGRHAWLHRYDEFIANSRYTIEWMERRWGVRADHLVHPPVDAGPAPPPEAKRPLILSVARFERSGSKRQLDLVRVFLKLRRAFPQPTAGWRLVLAGGADSPENPYLARVEAAAAAATGGEIELAVNAPLERVHELYRQASIFWHLCGFGAHDPAQVEHFGMTVAEAMRFAAVPVVFDGGGPREIVDDGETGYRVPSSAALLERTVELLADAALRRRLGAAAASSAERFGRPRFERQVRELFGGLLADYREGLAAELGRLDREL